MSGRTLLLAANFPPVTGGAARRFGEIYRRRPPGSMTVLTGAASPADAACDDPHVLRLSAAATARDLSGTVALRPTTPALRLLRDTVRSHRIERVQAGRVLPEGWLALAVRLLDGVPYDCFVHGEEINPIGNGEPGGFLRSRRYRLMTRLVLGGATRVIACSEFGAALARQHWRVDARRAHVLLPGVDTAYFSPDRDGASPPFAHWQGRRVILAAGRLQERKGYDVLIRAFAAVRHAASDALLVIAGDGEQGDDLRALVRQLGVEAHVSLLGAVSEPMLRACYRHCDVFVLANRQVGFDVEGFGMVLLEAQACGAPVIAGRSGGSPEALVDGTTGTVVDCTTPEPLAAALLDLLDDPERRAVMSRAARLLMEQRFDWDVILDEADWLFDDGGRQR